MGLKSGYSGAPIVEKESKRVIGVISHKQNEGKEGLGIEIEELRKIWRYIDSEELYQKLAKLGYRQQVRLFRRLVRKEDVAALLIYGPPDYGQRWLLNVLLTNHLPGVEMSKVVNVSLKRRGRSPSTQVLGRDFHRFWGLSNPVTLAEAAKAVYQCWQTRNVILIFHDVDWIGAENAKKLIEEFWQPLTQEMRKTVGKNREFSSKLFMFLIDYQGKTGKLNSIFRERAKENNHKQSPLKAPEIEEFTEEEIGDWIDEEREALPAQLIEEIDEQVERILDKSEGGIPELTLEEICASCGYNWIEEAEKWLKY